ncbi:MAG: metallophosphoesterase family protein [Tissierella sp.]|uniref:metallophosphoesterase family protein n=1 Tax=Tissierella sp. TaxID=41274 RepID=UPI003F9594C3
MSLKIFQTGDIHIGMKFNNYGDRVKESLVEARFSVIERMIDKSSDLNADLFVIAGDLFNSNKVAKKDINRTVNILNKFSGAAVLVLPGNHDYDNGKIDLWEEFSSFSNEKIILLNEKRYYNLKDYGIDALVYPAPCHNKHSKENSLGWIKKEGISKDGTYHIGVAHGAIEGLSADLEGNYYPMGIDELNDIATDVWLLGHTHVCYPAKEKISDHKIFNPGTPEPDGLDFNGKGCAWFIEIEGEEVNAKRVETGKYRFLDEKFSVNSSKDLEDIKKWAIDGKPMEKILRLRLEGSLSEEVYESLSNYYRDLESQLFHLMIEDSNLKIKINEEIIEREFTKGSFPYEFLNKLTHDEDALQIAYDLLRRD